MGKQISNLIAIFSAVVLSLGCQALGKRGSENDGASSVSSFTIKEFKPGAKDPDWATVTIEMQRVDVSQQLITEKFSHAQFKGIMSSNLSLTIPQGAYNISLRYADSSDHTLYKLCDSAVSRVYQINTPEFSTDLPICRADSTPAGDVAIAPSRANNIFPDAATCRDSSGRVNEGFDTVGGFCVDRRQSYFVQNGDIYNRGQKIILKGINWFGLEGASGDTSGKTTVDLRLGGLWTQRNMESFIDQMSSLGFNAWRLPLSPEALDPNTKVSDGFKSVPAEIEHFLDYANSKNMYVVLDMHNCGKDRYRDDKPGPGIPNSGCASYSESNWEDNLRTLANLAKDHPNVIAIDLFSEPFGFSWNDWSAMAARGAEAVLHTYPGVLVFVEGVGSRDNKSPTSVFWGENLTAAGTSLPAIPPSRLVFSPHVYGPAVSQQSYFNDSGFPGNMPQVWANHFGYLRPQGYALAIGEVGGTNKDQDKVWDDAFVSYLVQSNMPHFFLWAMNQNTGQTGGLFVDDQWTVVDQSKLNMLKPLLDLQP